MVKNSSTWPRGGALVPARPSGVRRLAERITPPFTGPDGCCALGFQVPGGDRAHAYLWRRLSNSGEAQVQTAGSDLNSLRGDRNQADYEVDRTLSRREALF